MNREKDEIDLKDIAKYISYRVELALYKILLEYNSDMTWEEFMLFFCGSEMLRKAAQCVAYESIELFDAKQFEACYALDDEGREVPTASPMVSFNCNSLGTIVGTGSANTDVAPVTSSERKMWNGRITVAVKVKDMEGTLKVYAQSENLKNAVLDIELNK